MADSVSLSASKIGRKLDISDEQRQFLAESIGRWGDGPVTVKVTRERPDKSALQMGYYHGLILPMIVEFTSGDADDADAKRKLHVWLKARFLDAERVEWTDETTGEIQIRDVIPSLADLTTTQMSDYSERVRAWALDFLGITIPEPDPAWRSKPSWRKKAIA